MNESELNYRHIIMARTARSLAFFAAITMLFGTMIFPFILGGLSIIFAVLSKGRNLKYQMSAKIALIVSCFALIGNTAYIGVRKIDAIRTTKRTTAFWRHFAILSSLLSANSAPPSLKI